MDNLTSGAEPPSGAPSFGYLLRRLRKAADLTQAELGQRAGCTANTVHKLETESRRPSRLLAERLAAALRLEDADRASFIAIARAEARPDRLALPEHPDLLLHPPVARRPLPLSSGRLIGRERELALLDQLLADPEVRLLTICGLGGSGKTRLALAAAERLLATPPESASRFADGIAFIALEGVHSTAQLISALAAAFALTCAYGSRSPRRQVLDYLRHRRLLLILDNFDHLIGEADLIAEILATAPAVTLLITSREPLQLRGEYVLLLEGVSVPPDGADGAAHGANAAVRLFVQAAERAQPGYVPSTDDLRAIAAIARLVEGLPLALELAAAWMRLLSPTAILAELQRSLALLHSDLRDAPERQRSIEAVCLAAWQRLSPAARDGFERLSVFEGGFTREAAREVAGLDLPELAVLVSHALVRHDPVTDRFGLHPLPRRFAAARLASDPARLAETRRRHATWHLDMLVARARELQTAGQFRALAALRREEGNMRAAWRHSLTEGMPALIARAAPALGRYYLWQGHTHEGVEAFAAALEAIASWNGAPEQQRLRATLMLWHAVFCHREGQGAAQAAIETSLALLDAAEHAGVEARPERAFGLWQLARIQASRGDGAATALLRQAVALYRALDLSWELGMVLADLGDHLRDEGSPDEAGEALREAQTIGERAGDEHSLARILQRRSQICLETGDPEEAEGLARRACELARRAGGPPDLAAALGWLGVVLMHRHNQGEAELRASLALYAELNEPAPLALAECRLALCLLHRGRLAEGLEHAHRAVAGDAQVGEAFQAQALLALGLGQWAAEDLAAAGASLEAGITLCRQHRLTTTLGMLLATLSGVAQDDPRRARAWAREALRIALERRNRLLLALLFTNAAALLLALGRPVRAAEVQALAAAGPFWGASELIAPRRAATLATLRATLDPGTLAAALDRGQALDPWAAAGQLAEELAVEE